MILIPLIEPLIFYSLAIMWLNFSQLPSYLYVIFAMYNIEGGFLFKSKYHLSQYYLATIVMGKMLLWYEKKENLQHIMRLAVYAGVYMECIIPFKLVPSKKNRLHYM